MGKASKAKQGRGADAASAQVLMNLQYAVALHQQGHLAQAKTIYLDVLQLQPHHPDALHLLGTIATKEKEFQRANDLIAKAVVLNPQNPVYQYNYGIALYELEQFEAAIAAYDHAIAIEPKYAPLHLNRGNAQQKLKQFDLAVISYNQAIDIQPAYAEAYSARGAALKALKQYDAARLSCERAIGLNPNLADAHSNLGNALLGLKRYTEAIGHYKYAMRLKPNFADVYLNYGAALTLLKKYDAAIASYQQAIALNSQYAKAYFYLGNAYSALRRPELAIQHFDRAMALTPDITHDIDYGYGQKLHAKQLLCDWTDIEPAFAFIFDQLAQDKLIKISMPFELLSMPSTAAQQKICAETYAQDEFLVSNMDFVAPIKTRDQNQCKKIKLGYFSSDFNNHPVGQLIVGMLEAHDRELFEVHGFGLMSTDSSVTGQRLMRAFDHFIDLTETTITQALETARNSHLDIAINLNGYTANSRTELFAYRIAPIQVNYLGYPGTMGSPLMDYIVADKTVIPPEHEGFYTEKLAYLPHSFLISSYASASLEKAPTRQEHLLPDKGFVFCCFNNSYKITPDIFDVWMRLLNQVEGSVLWLSKQSETVMKNLQQEAAQRGVTPNRLVFAQRLDSHEAHLARLGLADLFLDTLYYNAHTTAADALWAGLPIVTCLGASFPGRVAASLLRAIGLSEMVTPSIQAYEALALDLASHPAKLRVIKEKLMANRQTQPLFDTARTTLHLESAYQHMQKRYLQGLAPTHIHVTSSD